MFCSNCGAEMGSESKFCGSCGTVNSVASAPPPQHINSETANKTNITEAPPEASDSGEHHSISRLYSSLCAVFLFQILTALVVPSSLMMPLALLIFATYALLFYSLADKLGKNKWLWGALGLIPIINIIGLALILRASNKYFKDTGRERPSNPWVTAFGAIVFLMLVAKIFLPSITSSNNSLEADSATNSENAAASDSVMDEQPPRDATEPPVKISLGQNYSNGTPVLEIVATADKVIIESIQLNRGNCEPFALAKFPVTMAFGDTLKVGTLSCANIIEVAIETSSGGFEFTFGP